VIKEGEMALYDREMVKRIEEQYAPLGVGFVWEDGDATEVVFPPQTSVVTALEVMGHLETAAFNGWAADRSPLQREDGSTSVLLPWD
jgi:hypothetical protein